MKNLKPSSNTTKKLVIGLFIFIFTFIGVRFLFQGEAATTFIEDINQDGQVNLADFSLLASKYGQTGSGLGRSDINQDGKVDILDFSMFASKYGQSSGPPSTIWKPAQQTRWQWVLSGAVNTSEASRFDMYDIDLTDAIPNSMTQEVRWDNGYTATVTWPKGSNAGIIQSLKSSGKKVVCYMDTGAFEDYEPDASLFPGRWGSANTTRTVPYNGPPEYQNIDVLGGDSEDSSGGTFNGEYWLDIREQSWKYFAPIIWARLEVAKKIGCDGVEGDQNNSYGNDPTFGVNEAISLRWYREFFYQTHQRSMAAIAKNGVEIVGQMLQDPNNISYCTPGNCQPDGFLNEECHQYNECNEYDAALSKELWVGQVEYRGTSTAVCPDANSKHRMAMRKPQYDPVDMRISYACWEL